MNKYEITSFSCVPYLLAFLKNLKPPLSLLEAWKNLVAHSLKKTLESKEKYKELIKLRTDRKQSDDDVRRLEKDEDKNKRS